MIELALGNNPGLRAAVLELESARIAVTGEEGRNPLTLVLDAGGSRTKTPGLTFDGVRTSESYAADAGAELQKRFSTGLDLSLRLGTSMRLARTSQDPTGMFETEDLGSHLAEWPVTHVIKCLCFYHPNDPEELRAEQEERLLTLYDAARTAGRELLVEIIAGKHGPMADDTVATVVRRLYDLGIRPDWWKLEPQATRTAWQQIGDEIRARDPFCRGVVLLGLEASEAVLDQALAAMLRWRAHR